MAYTTGNREKYLQHVFEVYDSVKHYDVPDTFIVRNIFPKHNIYMSYVTWMLMKAKRDKKPEGNSAQLCLF